MVEDKSIDLESCILNLLRGAEDGRTMKVRVKLNFLLKFSSVTMLIQQ